MQFVGVFSDGRAPGDSWIRTDLGWRRLREIGSSLKAHIRGESAASSTESPTAKSRFGSKVSSPDANQRYQYNRHTSQPSYHWIPLFIQMYIHMHLAMHASEIYIIHCYHLHNVYSSEERAQHLQMVSLMLCKWLNELIIVCSCN